MPLKHEIFPLILSKVIVSEQRSLKEPDVNLHRLSIQGCHDTWINDDGLMIFKTHKGTENWNVVSHHLRIVTICETEKKVP